jgi:hypothetical protein
MMINFISAMNMSLFIRSYKSTFFTVPIGRESKALAAVLVANVDCLGEGHSYQLFFLVWRSSNSNKTHVRPVKNMGSPDS